MFISIKKQAIWDFDRDALDLQVSVGSISTLTTVSYSVLPFKIFCNFLQCSLSLSSIKFYTFLKFVDIESL